MDCFISPHLKRVFFPHLPHLPDPIRRVALPDLDTVREHGNSVSSFSPSPAGRVPKGPCFVPDIARVFLSVLLSIYSGHLSGGWIEMLVIAHTLESSVTSVSSLSTTGWSPASIPAVGIPICRNTEDQHVVTVSEALKSYPADF